VTLRTAPRVPGSAAHADGQRRPHQLLERDPVRLVRVRAAVARVVPNETT
jgi:hypothetical protein